jgi:hypothetical protein
MRRRVSSREFDDGTVKAVVKEDATAAIGHREDRWITDIVLKRNGSVGWIGRRQNYDQNPSVADYEVHRFSRDLSSTAGPPSTRVTASTGSHSR